MNFAQEAWFAWRRAMYVGTLVLIGAAALIAVFFVVVLGILRFVDPPTSAVMLRDRLVGAHIQYQWTPLDDISPNLIRSVVSSEDARFCSHHGVDWREVAHAVRAADRDGIEAARGASTITMQVAKNLFLWTGRSLARKGLELAITQFIELMWPKRRIMEVYLNIAQFGPGVFGAGAAARYHFKIPPDELTVQQASLLTAALPAPGVRSAGRATPHTQRIARRIRARMRPGSVDVDCVLRPDERAGQEMLAIPWKVAYKRRSIQQIY